MTPLSRAIFHNLQRGHSELGSPNPPYASTPRLLLDDAHTTHLFQDFDATRPSRLDRNLALEAELTRGTAPPPPKSTRSGRAYTGIVRSPLSPTRQWIAVPPVCTWILPSPTVKLATCSGSQPRVCEVVATLSVEREKVLGKRDGHVTNPHVVTHPAGDAPASAAFCKGILELTFRNGGELLNAEVAEEVLDERLGLFPGVVTEENLDALCKTFRGEVAIDLGSINVVLGGAIKSIVKGTDREWGGVGIHDELLQLKGHFVLGIQKIAPACTGGAVYEEQGDGLMKEEEVEVDLLEWL